MDNTGFVTAQQGVVNQTDSSTRTNRETVAGTVVPKKNEAVQAGDATAGKRIDLPPDFTQRIAGIKDRLGANEPVTGAFEKLLNRIAGDAPEKLEAHIGELDNFSRNGGAIERFIRITSNLAELYREVTASGENTGATGVSYGEVARELATDVSPSDPPFPFNQDFVRLYNEYLERLVSGEGHIGKWTAERLAQENAVPETEPLRVPSESAPGKPATPADAALHSAFDAEA